MYTYAHIIFIAACEKSTSCTFSHVHCQARVRTWSCNRASLYANSQLMTTIRQVQMCTYTTAVNKRVTSGDDIVLESPFTAATMHARTGVHIDTDNTNKAQRFIPMMMILPLVITYTCVYMCIYIYIYIYTHVHNICVW